MIKLVRGIIISLLVISTFVCASKLCAEDVDIKTSDGEITTVIVPEDYESLKEAYLDMVEMYLEAEIDLTKMIEKYDSMLDNVLALQEINSRLIEQNVYLEQLLERKVKRENFQLFAISGIGHDFKEDNQSFSLGFELQVFEKVSLGITYETPLGVKFMVGVKIF